MQNEMAEKKKLSNFVDFSGCVTLDAYVSASDI